MAIREKNKKGGGKFWEVYWKNPFTKRLQSKNFHDAKEAKDFNTDILYRLKRDKESFRPAQVASDAPLTHFQGLALRYLKEQPMADSTRRDTLYHLSALYETMGNPTVEDIDKAFMKKFERELRKPYTKTYTSAKGKEYTRQFEGRKQRTIHRKVDIVKAVLNWGVEEGYIPGHNLNGYRCAKGEDVKLIPPSPEELQLIRKHAAPHVDRAIYLSFNFGLRVGGSELFKLTWDRIDLTRKMAFIPAAEKNKNVQWRQVDIRENMLPTLREWKEQDEAKGITHVINYKGKPITTLKTAWRATLKRAGITRRVRPYDLRHSFATEALAAGADPKAVAEIMGHADMSMIHKHYQHVLNRQKKAAVDALPSI